MAARVEAVGAVPLNQLGKGPMREPPDLARSVDRLLDHAESLMRGYYADAGPDAVWRPLAIAVCRNGEVAQMLQADHFPRDEWASTLREVFREAGVVRYAYAMEAWMSLPDVALPAGTDPRDPALDRLLDSGVPPAEDPGRREVAVLLGVEDTGRAQARVLEIVRAADGTVAEVRDVTASLGGPGSSVAGAFGPLARLLQGP